MAQSSRSKFVISEKRTVSQSRVRENQDGEKQRDGEKKQTGILAGFLFFPDSGEKRKRHEKDRQKDEEPLVIGYPFAHSGASQAKTGQEDRHLSAKGKYRCGENGAYVAEDFVDRVSSQFHMSLI